MKMLFDQFISFCIHLFPCAINLVRNALKQVLLQCTYLLSLERNGRGKQLCFLSPRVQCAYLHWHVHSMVLFTHRYLVWLDLQFPATLKCMTATFHKPSMMGCALHNQKLCVELGFVEVI